MGRRWKERGWGEVLEKKERKKGKKNVRMKIEQKLSSGCVLRGENGRGEKKAFREPFTIQGLFGTAALPDIMNCSFLLSLCSAED